MSQNIRKILPFPNANLQEPKYYKNQIADLPNDIPSMSVGGTREGLI